MTTPDLSGRVDPGEVAEVRVGRDADDLDVERGELRHPVAERDDLRRADKRAAAERTTPIRGRLISLQSSKTCTVLV